MLEYTNLKNGLPKMAMPEIDERHRLELLRFLLVKTAAVRRGIKPAELLRVRHCYSAVNSQGLRVCLYRRDIYVTLGLDYLELKVEEGSSLVLFYNPSVLAATLRTRGIAHWLGRLGYPVERGMEAMLAHLKSRFADGTFSHEVGLFIGYPLKDVVGFIKHLPSTPVHNGAWRVYGVAKESLERMVAYAREESEANRLFAKARCVRDFIDMISYTRPLVF